MSKYCLNCNNKITKDNSHAVKNPITKELIEVYKCCKNPYIYTSEDLEKEKNRLVVIDADSIIWKIAWRFKDKNVTKTSKKNLHKTLDELVYEIISKSKALNYLGLLIDKNESDDSRCFRYGLCDKYKEKRPETPDFIKLWGEEIREYLHTKFKFQYVTKHIEVDDAVSILNYQIKDKEVIIASIDKDLLQIPSLHINYNNWTQIDARPKDDSDLGFVEYSSKKVRGHGALFLACQCLEGDSIDGITGVPGIGPSKAYSNLKHCTTKYSITKKLLEVYQSKKLGKLDLIKNYRLLKLLDNIESVDYLDINVKEEINENINNIKLNISTITF